ncbi:MAG TPA: hypothetical protein VFE34_04280 [Dongiaceae bacterium]|jgi:Asp-tRNA(Asn)/Glu-tRNA(Gln) amidotransferase A subunit family amidase|nr:hypothetical protein [Dongiaceae bacterium]
MLEGMIGESISIPRVQLAGLCIGLLRHPGADKFLQQDIQALFDHVVEILQKAGAQVQPIELAGLELARDALVAIIEPEASLIHRDLLRDQPTGFSDITRAQLEAGSAVTAISASPLTASSNTLLSLPHRRSDHVRREPGDRLASRRYLANQLDRRNAEELDQRRLLHGELTLNWASNISRSRVTSSMARSTAARRRAICDRVSP